MNTQEQIAKIIEEIAEYITAYKDICERNALAETPIETAKELYKIVISSLASTPDEALLLTKEEITQCYRNTKLPVPSAVEREICKAQLAKVQTIYAARVEQAKQEARKELLKELRDELDKSEHDSPQYCDDCVKESHGKN